MTAEGPLCRTVRLHFPVGLHVRPATLIAQEARKYQAEVFLVYNERRANARNVFDMFLLGAEKGAEMTLESLEGPDREAALAALAALFTPEFAESYKTPEE